MIYGVVNLRREATLPLVVGNINKQQKVIDTVIDTGFSGFLSLPSSIITTLELPFIHCECDLGWAVSRDLYRRNRTPARNGIALWLSIAG
jgi:hypothetical protein